jgi:hypothetical protein
MTYSEFKATIQSALENKPSGATWSELKSSLPLPYARACPEWTRRLKDEIGLTCRKGTGRELIWSLENRKKRDV